MNSIFILILCLVMFLKDFISSLPYNNLNYTNIYGDDYGTNWIFLPDGDGVPHYVDLRRYDYEYMLDLRGTAAEDIEFRLYLGNDTETYLVLDEFAQPVKTDINDKTTYILKLSDKPLKIITHGWKSSVDKEGVASVKNAYIEAQKANVITMDWSEIANSIFYHWVANETKAIGARVATFIGALHNRYNVSGKQLHLIGHSLGAHIMGIAASRSNFRVDRITGLDPARPLFEYPIQEKLAKLDASDADFVDVIHTCSGVLGFEAAIGTVDFYPNNGTAPQPGCESLQKIFEACSHGRSFLYFSESIRRPYAFPAYQCSSWIDYIQNRCSNFGVMGEEVGRNMSGKYYLKTKAFYPFGFSFG